MYLRRERDDGSTVIATEVEIAESTLAQHRGLMFRRSLPEGSAMVFPFEDVGIRDVHMLFVFHPLDVCWLRENEVIRIERMRPFVSFARAAADMLVELPAADAADVAVGDRLYLDPEKDQRG